MDKNSLVKFKIIVLILSFSLVYVGCKKGDEDSISKTKTQLLCQKWKMVEAYENDLNLTSNYDYFYSEYKIDGTFTDYLSKNDGNIEYIETYIWNWNEDKTGIEITHFFGIVYVLELTDTKLTIEYKVQDDIRRRTYEKVNEIPIQ